MFFPGLQTKNLNQELTPAHRSGATSVNISCPVYIAIYVRQVV